ncbi:MAG: GGDEF domain-containing protein [Thermodesulfovibrio sp.]|nr:GGDEF domain-containing protein [Thermodesulfovibrio sp.]
MVLVKNAMTNNVYSLSLENSISELIELMSKRGVGSIVIVNNEEVPVQILTLRDIPKIFSIYLTTHKIKDLLSELGKNEKDIITVRPNQHLIIAMQLMNKNNISHLPVVNRKNKLVGILSMRDLLKHFPGIVFTDPLTHVNNRMYLDIIRTKIEKNNVKLGILMIDIDNFKNINDQYGHPVGDLVLKEIAKTIKNSIKSYDEVIRYGGEEFVVILYRCDEKFLPIIGERLRNHIKKIKFPKYEKLSVTVSIGGYIYHSDGDIYDGIIKADQAMYKAKKSGKDKFVYADR